MPAAVKILLEALSSSSHWLTMKYGNGSNERRTEEMQIFQQDHITCHNNEIITVIDFSSKGEA